MLIPDANVLLYAVNADVEQHAEAKAWLDGALSRREAVGFGWVVLLAFIRISTRAGIFDRPLTTDEAMGIVEAWLAQASAVVAEPTTRHAAILRGLLDEVGAGGNLVTDAHIAALAVEHAAEIATYDSDFDRFPGVRWRRPTLENTGSDVALPKSGATSNE